MASSHVQKSTTFPNQSPNSDRAADASPSPTKRIPPEATKDTNYKDVSTLKDPEPDNTRCRGEIWIFKYSFQSTHC